MNDIGKGNDGGGRMQRFLSSKVFKNPTDMSTQSDEVDCGPHLLRFAVMVLVRDGEVRGCVSSLNHLSQQHIILLLIVRYSWFLPFSDTSGMLEDHEKGDFITNFLEWKQEKDPDKRQNCLLLSFGAPDLDYGLSQIRWLLWKEKKQHISNESISEWTWPPQMSIWGKESLEFRQI